MYCLCIVRRGDPDSRCPLLLNRICFATLSRELKTGAVIAAIGEVTSYLLLFTMWDILMGSLRYLHRFAPSHMIFSTELYNFQCCQCMHKLWKWNGQKKRTKTGSLQWSLSLPPGGGAKTSQKRTKKVTLVGLDRFTNFQISCVCFYTLRATGQSAKRRLFYDFRPGEVIKTQYKKLHSVRPSFSLPHLPMQ